MDKNIAFLQGISDYFQNQTRPDGSLICQKHKIEHTGKNVYSSVIDSKLYALTGQKVYYERALKRIRRTVKNLYEEQPGKWIFYPSTSRWNMSNAVIDSGAAADVLADFYLTYQNKLSQQDKQAIKEAVFKNAQGYLREAVVSKDITNQRLWGGAGLSRAYSLFQKQDWKQALLICLKKSFEEMSPDGAFLYQPNWQKTNGPRGAGDITTYYHSRCIVFAYYILENLGEEIGKHKEKLIKAADLLMAMQQPNGIKNINLEAKRWYWHSPYEIASNAYDIYALLKIYELTRESKYLYYAQKAYFQLLKHQLKDGGITSHLKNPQHNFQCRIFWNSHLAWFTRVIEQIPESPVEESEEGLSYFPQSGIIKSKSKDVCFIIRSKKQPASLMWGSLFDGLLYFSRRANNWQNEIKLTRPKFRFKQFSRALWTNKKEIKKRLYHIFIELRGRRLRTAFYLLFSIPRTLKNL